MKLKIMTYNIAQGRCYADDSKIADNGWAPEDLSACAQVIKELAPDVCGLNEVGVFAKDRNPANQPEFLSAYTGMAHHYFGAALHFVPPSIERDYGNAILSRHPILESETIKIPDPERRDEDAYYETRAIAKVKLDIAGGITVLQTHFGLAVSEKQNAITTLCKIIDETEGPIILMGDFNIRPTDFLHEHLRARLFDTADIRKGEYLKTYPSYTHKESRSENYPDCKIDYIYVSEHFKVNSIVAPQHRASDHYPYVTELELEEA